MQFHNPKDMAAALAIEAAELQEIFLWKIGPEIEETAERKRLEIGDELADIAIYLIELADNLRIDLPAAIDRKDRNKRSQYPSEKVQGTGHQIQRSRHVIIYRRYRRGQLQNFAR